MVAQLVQAPATRSAERSARERARELLDEVGLSDRADAFATDLSYGQTKRLELARALNTEPRVLLLDEPVAGMNDRQAAEILNLVMTARERRGLTLVVIEHNVPVLVGLVERLIAFEAGSVIAQGQPTEVVRHPRVVSAYLGAAA